MSSTSLLLPLALFVTTINAGMVESAAGYFNRGQCYYEHYPYGEASGARTQYGWLSCYNFNYAPGMDKNKGHHCTKWRPMMMWCEQGMLQMWPSLVCCPGGTGTQPSPTAEECRKHDFTAWHITHGRFLKYEGREKVQELANRRTLYLVGESCFVNLCVARASADVVMWTLRGSRDK